MKHLIFLLFIVLNGCHVHYHIDQAKEIRVKTTTDNYKPDGCGVIGCCVLHGGTPYPSIPLGYDIDSGFYGPTHPYSYPELTIKGGHGIKMQQDTIKGTITFISDSAIYPNVRSVHAATELTKKQKDFFKNLKPNQ